MQGSGDRHDCRDWQRALIAVRSEGFSLRTTVDAVTAIRVVVDGEDDVDDGVGPCRSEQCRM